MRLSSHLLECGTGDIKVLERIDENVMVEAIEEIKESGLRLNFPFLYMRAVKIALYQVGIFGEDVEVSSNYLDSGVYIKEGRKVPKGKIRALKDLGFNVFY